MDIEVADTMPDGWQRWLDWHRQSHSNNREEIKALETDRGRVPRLRPRGRSPEAERPAARSGHIGAVDDTRAPLLRSPT